MPDRPEPLTKERRKTHGEWADTARIANLLKQVLHGEIDRLDAELGAARTEALGQIMFKIARIISGDPNHADHWLDIAGYALLGKGGSE
jgi:hypothetical protein